VWGVDPNGEVRSTGAVGLTNSWRNQLERSEKLVSREGVEPSTNRLRDRKEPGSEGGGS